MTYLPKFYSSEDIRREYIRSNSGHFFDKDTMRFFRSRLTSNFKKISDNEYLFITTEKACFNDYTRVASVRLCKIIPDDQEFRGYKLEIETIDSHHATSLYKAKKYLEQAKRAD